MQSKFLNSPRICRCFLLAPMLLAAAGSGAQSIFDSKRVLHRDAVYFAFSRSELDTAALSVLDAFSAVWKDAGSDDCTIRITAHTDSVGSLPHNLALSQRRAQTIRAALLQRGLPDTLMTLAYFGERQPVASNGDEAGRQRNRRGTLEILKSIPMTPYSGQVKDKTTGNGIPATVHFSTRTLRDSVQTDSAGQYAVQLPKDSIVKIEAYAQGYFFSSVMQRIYGSPGMLNQMKDKPAELTLAPAKVGEKAVVNNLYFVGNEAILLKTSEPELPKVLKFMQINSGLSIEIAGHINHPGLRPDELEKWEWALSANRAKLVYIYLLKNGVPESRMTYKGYGNSEMIFPEGGTDEQQEQNRRVEIRVTGGR